MLAFCNIHLPKSYCTEFAKFLSPLHYALFALLHFLRNLKNDKVRGVKDIVLALFFTDTHYLLQASKLGEEQFLNRSQLKGLKSW